VTGIEVVNVVGNIPYQQRFDLGALEDDLKDKDEISEVVYEPSENHWIQTRFGPNETYVAFYQNGQCSIEGCQSVDSLYETVDMVKDMMDDILEIDVDPRAGVRNIAVTREIGMSIPLEALAVELGLENVEYEPEQFSGLVYHDAGCALLIFPSGKLLCTGLNDLNRIQEVIEVIEDRIRRVL
jgi:transcription initiation factor TFIID TATA-box-binding protein